jgi:hypothetical protein
MYSMYHHQGLLSATTTTYLLTKLEAVPDDGTYGASKYVSLNN